MIRLFYVAPIIKHLTPYDEVSNYDSPPYENFSEFFMSKFLSDVTIVCGEKEIAAHKFILASKIDQYIYQDMQRNLHTGHVCM